MDATPYLRAGRASCSRVGNSQGEKILENACKGLPTFHQSFRHSEPLHQTPYIIISVLIMSSLPSRNTSLWHSDREKSQEEKWPRRCRLHSSHLPEDAQLKPAFFCSSGVSKFYSAPSHTGAFPTPSPASYAKWLLLSHFPFPSRKSPLWNTDTLSSLN